MGNEADESLVGYTYANSLEDGSQTGKVLHARAEGCDGGLEQRERGAQRGDTISVCRGGGRGRHCGVLSLEAVQKAEWWFGAPAVGDGGFATSQFSKL